VIKDGRTCTRRCNIIVTLASVVEERDDSHALLGAMSSASIPLAHQAHGSMACMISIL
jgi:hypothetical protein